LIHELHASKEMSHVVSLSSTCRNR
jgi:hypothetical protein